MIDKIFSFYWQSGNKIYYGGLKITHWVIRIHKEKICAGADRIASTPDAPSQLSGSGTAPSVFGVEEVNKIAEHEEKGRSCVI